MKVKIFHKILKLTFFCLFALQSSHLAAQFPVFKREQRLNKQANELYAEKNYIKAIAKFKEIASRYDGNADIWYKIAVSYQEIDQPDRAEVYYNRVIKTDDDANPIVHLSLGQVLMMQGKYDEARKHFMKYNELLEFNDQLAMRYISSIENIERYFEDSAYFTKENLPVNSEASDFGATTINNSFYFLSTRNKKNEYNERYSSDLFVSNINNETVFEAPKKMSGPANTRFGEIGYAIVPKTNEIFICRYEPGQQDEYSLGYNLYKAYLGVNKEISRPSKFELDKFRYAIAYPTLSDDGKFMIFASDAPGGFGGWDLYQADYTPNGLENIQNMGDKVNSAGDELYPYMMNDSIVFFATDGHGGLGGFDIYSKNLAQENDYSRNLGNPINSAANDYGVYFDSGLSGYFTSNREGGVGHDDIYRFTIHQLKLSGEVIDEGNGENLKNVNVSVKRSVGNDEMLALADNGKLVLKAQPGEQLEITIEKEGYETKSFTVNTSDMSFIGNHTLQIGKFPVVKLEPEPITFELDPKLLEKPKTTDIFFAVQIAASKSTISTRNLERKYTGDQEIVEFFDGKYYRYFIGKQESYFEAKELWKSRGKKDILVAYKEDKSIRVMKALKEAHVEPAEAKDPEVHEFIDKTNQLNSEIIYYGLDLFRIPDNSEKELDKILKMLNDNPDYFLEIAAHTDKRGSDMYNRALSEERAKFLRRYFLEQGISELRIISHGIGEKQLKKYCAECTESDHKLNRRAELIIRVYKEQSN